MNTSVRFFTSSLFMPSSLAN